MAVMVPGSNSKTVGKRNKVYDETFTKVVSNGTRDVDVGKIVLANEMTSAITAEKSARESAVSGVQSQVTTLSSAKADKTALDTEATARATGDAGRMPTAPTDGKEYVAAGSTWKVAASGGGAANPPQFLFASGKRQLTVKAGTSLKKQDGSMYSAAADVVIDCTPTKGKDHYVHLGNNNAFTVSTTKTNASAVLVGGFHALCANVAAGLTYTEDGTSKAHPLAGYVAADILPHSVWCLNHRPHSEPEGMVYIPTIGFWCDIYLASGTGAATKSAYQGTITRTRQIGDFMEDMFLVGKELLDDSEFAAAMLGSNECTSVAGASDAGATSGGAGGRSDTAGRRMISIYGVEEGCGSLWQFLRHCTTGGSAAWATQSGGKGSFYQTNVVIAGGHWSAGAYCGSRARFASNARSSALAYNGGRGRSRHVSS